MRRTLILSSALAAGLALEWLVVRIEARKLVAWQFEVGEKSGPAATLVRPGSGERLAAEALEIDE
jgi:hypothetical protein